MRREVTVTEAEPARAGAIGGELGQDGEGLVGAPPALLLVDPAAQRVHDGVQVGADVQAEQVDVVAGVADDRDLGIWRGGLQAAQEAGAAYAARENGDAHVGSLATGPAGRPPSPPERSRRLPDSAPPSPVRNRQCDRTAAMRSLSLVSP